MKKNNFKSKRISAIVLIAFILVQIFSIAPLKVKAEENFSVEILVEGMNGIIASGTSTNTNAKEAVNEILKRKNLNYEVKTDKGGFIESVAGIGNDYANNKYWYTAINRNNTYPQINDGIEQIKLENKDRYILYICGYNETFVPNDIKYSTNLPDTKLEITLDSTYDDWSPTGTVTKTKHLEGVKAKIDGNEVPVDGNKIVIDEGLPLGNHTIEVSGYRENQVPTVLNDILQITIGTNGGGTNPNNPQNIYDRDNRNIVKNINNDINVTSSYVSNISNIWTPISLNKLGLKSNEDIIKSYNSDITTYGIKEYSSTELEKLIIALTACGYSPYNFAGNDLVSELYNRNVNDFIVNETIFALLTYNYANINENYKITKDSLVSHLMNEKLTFNIDNKEVVGWSLTKDKIDSDITGMAINALAPYYNTNASVKEAIDKAITTLSNMQTSSGYIAGANGITSETISTIILGLASVGMNPDDERFTKTKGDLVTALLSFKGDNGQFKHILDGGNDNTATEQALRALIALKEFKANGKYNFYLSNIDASKLPVYSAKEVAQSTTGTESKEILPQTGSFLDTNSIAVAGMIFIIMGLGMAFINKRKVLNK